MTLGGPLVLLSKITQGKALDFNWGWQEAQHWGEKGGELCHSLAASLPHKLHST